MKIDLYDIAAEHTAFALAESILSVAYERSALEIAALFVLEDRSHAECRRIAIDLLAYAPPPNPPSRASLASFLLQNPSFHSAFSTNFWHARLRFTTRNRTTSTELIEVAIAQYPQTAKHFAQALAASLLAGQFERQDMRRRTEALLGPLTRTDQRRLVAQIRSQRSRTYAPSSDWLVGFLLERPLFHRAISRARLRPDLIHHGLEPPRFAPLSGFTRLAVRRIATQGDLARWLHVTLTDLDWFSDNRRRHAHTAIPVLQNYTFSWMPKRSGPPRLIEAPKPRLRTIQRKILDEILSKVPVHDAAFGFVEGRSAAQGAARHVGEVVVVTCDIENFFTTVPARRVHAVFRSIGYPAAVARALTGLVTTTTPDSVLAHPRGKERPSPHALQLHRRQHLAQGAPTSPALSNLCAWRLDCRLSGLAKRYEARYTRYADDMTFSGDAGLRSRAKFLLHAVQAIIEDEGFRLHPAKTHIATRSQRQQVTGIVVNEHLNVSRVTYDLLKATLHNAVKNGWQSENRHHHPAFKAHLDGRITWVENLNPHRGAKLRRLFDRIKWI